VGLGLLALPLAGALQAQSVKNEPPMRHFTEDEVAAIFMGLMRILRSRAGRFASGRRRRRTRPCGGRSRRRLVPIGAGLRTLHSRCHAPCSSLSAAVPAAAREGQVDVVGLLLERGADADAEAAGKTAMTLAETGSHVRVIHMLREFKRKAAG
jgi:hypothetical protein